MKVLEILLDWLLEAVTFFDNLKSRRGDDPVMARYRGLKRACFWSTVVPFVLLGFLFLLANAFNGLSDALRNPETLEGLRPAVAYGALGVVVLATLIAAYNYWRLWRFTTGADDVV